MKALKNVRLELHRVSQFDAALQLPNLARGTRSRPAVHVCALGSSVFTRTMTELAVLAQRRQAIRGQYICHFLRSLTGNIRANIWRIIGLRVHVTTYLIPHSE